MAYTYSDDLISDYHKDAYGFRPNEGYMQWWDACSPEQKQAEWDALGRAVESSIREEEEQQAACLVKFNALVEKTIADGAKDRETALRWIMEASGCDGDWDYLAWTHGIPYGYFRKTSKVAA